MILLKGPSWSQWLLFFLFPLLPVLGPCYFLSRTAEIDSRLLEINFVAFPSRRQIERLHGIIYNLIIIGPDKTIPLKCMKVNDEIHKWLDLARTRPEDFLSAQPKKLFQHFLECRFKPTFNFGPSEVH